MSGEFAYTPALLSFGANRSITMSALMGDAGTLLACSAARPIQPWTCLGIPVLWYGMSSVTGGVNSA